MIKHDTVPAPYPVQQIVVNVDSVPYADSAYCKALALKYYSMNIYNDTLLKDSTALIVLRDTVTKNMLRKRGLDFKNYQKTMIITKTITTVEKQSSMQFYGGIDLTYKLIAPAMMLQKDKFIYKVGFEAVNKVPLFGVYYKLY